MSNINELKDLKIDELEVVLEDLEKDIFQLTNQLKMNRKLEKPHELKDKKKDRARAKFILAQKLKEGSK